MPNSSRDFVWTLLESGDVADVKALAPSNFNWYSLHPQHHITALQVAAIFGITSSAKFKDYLELVKWLLSCGAEPEQETPKTCGFIRLFWKNADKPGTEVKLPFAETSAISVVVECRKILAKEMADKGKSKADWSEEISNLSRVLELFAKTPKASREKVLVDHSVVDLWERICGATSTHDVTFVTKDGEVTAHELVLTQASPVLAAMLQSSMREGGDKCIQVKDASKTGVLFFLELLYTGSSCSDPDVQAALSALDLAHRWQADGVVTMTEKALETMLSEESFPRIAEAAALKGLADLKKACTGFAACSKAVKQKIKEGDFPKVVLDMFGVIADTKPASKKRRTF